MLRLLRQGKLSKWFSGIGQEAIAVGVDAALQPRRRHPAACTATSACSPGRGLDLAQCCSGSCSARPAGSRRAAIARFISASLDHGIVGMISHLGAMLPVADGLALAFQLRGESRVAAAFTGDGGDERRRLPRGAEPRRGLEAAGGVHHREQSIRTLDARLASSTPARISPIAASATACRAWSCDGNDLLAVVRRDPRGRRRGPAPGEGPTLIEFETFRMRGHEEASGTDYVPEALFEEWAARRIRCLRFERLLDDARRGVGARARGAAAGDEDGDRPARGRGRGGARSRVRRVGGELADVYATAAAVCDADDADGSDARDALPRRHHRWPARGDARGPERSILLGQDIAEYGGVFKVTEGLVEEFGKARVRNTPIIESGAIGAALGLALEGFRADGRDAVRRLHLVRLQPDRQQPREDALPLGRRRAGRHACADRRRHRRRSVPLAERRGVVHAAWPASRWSHRRRRPMPRACCSRRSRTAIPCCISSTSSCIARLAARSPKASQPYRSAGRRIARAGRDATVVTYGVGVHWALEAATALAAEGREIEVIDLRSLLPWDTEMVLESVKQDRARLVLHEAPPAAASAGKWRRPLARERSNGSMRRSRGSARSIRRCRSARRSKRCSRRGHACCRRSGSCWRIRWRAAPRSDTRADHL